MIDELVKQEPKDSSAAGLTDAYNRMRDASQRLVDASPELPSEEFGLLFEALPPVSPPAQLDNFVEASAKLESDAKKASILLRQLSGWFQGVVLERTLKQRIEADARARAELAAKAPTGFT